MPWNIHTATRTHEPAQTEFLNGSFTRKVHLSNAWPGNARLMIRASQPLPLDSHNEVAYAGASQNPGGPGGCISTRSPGCVTRHLFGILGEGECPGQRPEAVGY